VTATDPQAVETSRTRQPALDYRVVTADALADAELVILLTEWREFRELDPEEVGRTVAELRVIDGRNALDREAWRSAGWDYRALGRG